MIPNVFLNNLHHLAAAVQVAVFADRVEIWNPGELLPPLTPDSLRVPHRSITRNHRVCEALFLAGYIEKYGTGTLMMIRESVEHALPEPLFKQSGGEFVATIGRDWLTEDLITRLGFSDRQARGLLHIKLHGRISNATYRQTAGVSESTALRDLKSLADMGLLEKTEGTGRTAQYQLAKAKPVINPSNPSLSSPDETRHKPVKPVMQGDTNRTNGISGARTRRVKSSAVKTVDSHNQLMSKAMRKSSAIRKLPQVTSQATPRGGAKRGPSRRQGAHDQAHDEAHDSLRSSERRILEACRSTSRSTPELLAALGYACRTGNFKHSLKHLLDMELLAMTMPGKPRSKKQTYRLTPKGRNWLSKTRPLARRNQKGEAP